jgi:hypothetical protein
MDFPIQTEQEGDALNNMQTHLANCFAVPEAQVIATAKYGEDMILHVTRPAFANIKPNMSLISAIDCRYHPIYMKGVEHD